MFLVTLEMINSEFIFGNFIKDISLCDNIIDFFESTGNSHYRKPGIIGGEVNKHLKDSTDLPVSPNSKNPIITNYIEQLNIICEQYKEKYKWCHETHHPWSLVSKFNIQKYEPGQGFHTWHMERNSSLGPTFATARHLAFMTYLNDVEDGGETEWFYQKLKVKPQKGLTLIWPVDWTHTHRGITSPSETKYIVTGWYSYTYPESMQFHIPGKGVYFP